MSLSRIKGVIMDTLHEKQQRLETYLSELGSVAVAFSSGVDSTFLLKTAKKVLGDNVIAVTARSQMFPERELRDAKAFCESEGIRHIIIESEELSMEEFRRNPPDRCYLCKRRLLKSIIDVAAKHKIAHIAEGSNMDDNGDYRPGLKAISELEVKSPLQYAGLTKSDIRTLSAEMGLPTWDKPSFACLATRFVYGEEITEEKLRMVDKGEQLLLDLGFKQVRVRVHGNIARIEVLPAEFEKLLDEKTRSRITDEFKDIGFGYTAMDLSGYRTGSMNETLEEKQKTH